MSGVIGFVNSEEDGLEIKLDVGNLVGKYYCRNLGNIEGRVFGGSGIEMKVRILLLFGGSEE